MEKIDLLTNVLLSDSRLTDNAGTSLLKNKVHELAEKMDEQLLKLLIENEETKNWFFKDLNGVLVFDKQQFEFVINNKSFLPDSYTRFKKDIGLVDENNNSFKKNDCVVLSFPHKDCLLEMDSTDTKKDRNEMFYNEILMKNQIDTLLEPKVFTGIKKYGLNSIETPDVFFNDNLIIKGNNLLVLHSLLSRYREGIKFMYWDVLYNTENQNLAYSDSFKHSTWLTFMKNRLEVAKELLRNDGAICIQCDDNEMHYLKVLCDEIFGRENCINTICVEMSPSSGVKRKHRNVKFIKNKEYILLYKKNNALKIKPLYDAWEKYDKHFGIFYDGKEYTTVSKKIKETFGSNIPLEKILYFKDLKKFVIDNSSSIFQTHGASQWARDNYEKGEIVFDDGNKKVVKVLDPKNSENFELLISGGKTRLEPLSWNIEEGEISKLRGDLWLNYDKDMGNVGKEGGVKLSGGKKPERLIADILKAFTDEGDIVLDAFLGSGTTAAVAHKMKRKYIGIEQLDENFSKAKKRLESVVNGDETGVSKKVNWQNGGTFITCELKQRNEKILNKIFSSTAEDLLNLYSEICSSEFVSYRLDINKAAESLEDFKGLKDDEKRKLLIEILDKNMIYVNYSDIDDVETEITDLERRFNHSFYNELYEEGNK